MIKEHIKAFRQLMLFSDIATAALAFFSAYMIKGSLDDISVNVFFEPLALLIVVLGFSFSYFGLYSSFRIKSIVEVFFNIIKAVKRFFASCI